MRQRDALSLRIDGTFGPETSTSDFQALSGVSRPRAWSLTLLALLALAVTLVDRQVLAALASTVTGALHISNVRYGWLSSGFATAYLAGSMGSSAFIRRFGPRVGFAVTVGLTSLVIGVHAVASGFVSLLALRVALGLVVAAAFPCAIQTVHRVLPFKDRARATGMLYFGNSLGSAVCVPVAVLVQSSFGWRGAFVAVGLVGLAWLPIWLFVSSSEDAKETLEHRPLVLPRQTRSRTTTASHHDSIRGLLELVSEPGVLRGGLVVAAAAPITTVMLLWGSKYLGHDHGLSQARMGHYLWLPALVFGGGSVLFGELRARTAQSRKARPPRLLLGLATLLGLLMATVPLAHGPGSCVLLASLAMGGAGGLYTLATADMLAHAPRGTVPIVSGFTTLTQSVVYIAINPIIGKLVEHFGNYHWVMVGAGLWLVPGCAYWLIHASTRASTA